MELSSLMKKHQLTDKDINTPVNVSNLELISHFCYKQWKSLPPYLGLQSSVVSKINKIQKEDEIKCLDFLIEWMVTKDTGATYKQLLTALLMINCDQSAEMLCMKLKESAPSSKTSQSLIRQPPVSGGTTNCASGISSKSKTGKTKDSSATNKGTSSTYTRGSLVGSDKEWYHGELTRDEAEQVLKVSGCDCFLIRHNQGVLVVSLIHDGEIHHITIQYGPGWYELENGSAPYSFTGVEALVTFYKSHPISPDLAFTLGQACEKTPGYSSILTSPTPHYTKQTPAELIKHYWFYGNITEDHTKAELDGSGNNFLVRHTSNTLILSFKISGWIQHTVILYSPEGYCLEGKDRHFQSIPEMIAHYQKYPIEEEFLQVLGTGCDRRYSVYSKAIERINSVVPTLTFKKKTDALKLTWERKADLPVGISSPQIVKINNFVFVGSGLRKQFETSAIFQYNVKNNRWTELPHCPADQQGLATLNDELISVGGRNSQGTTNNVYTFSDSQWKEALPPMPTPRYFPSIVSHNDFIVAAGGSTGISRDGITLRTQTVEIYIRDKQWYSTKQIPIPLSIASTCVIGDTCYIQGGSGLTTLQVSLPSLVEKAASATGLSLMHKTKGKWKTMTAKYPLHLSSIEELQGQLIALGGSYDKTLRRGTRFISCYDFATDTWVECQGAQLPVPLYRSGVMKLAGNKVMLIGGQPEMKQFSNEVYVGSYDYFTYDC